MATGITTRKAAAAFKAIVEKVGRDDVAEILANWNDYELSEDGSKIVCYVGRDRENSHGTQGGKGTVSKKEFLEWLLSDEPFDKGVYGEGILTTQEWVGKIESARKASRLGEMESP